MDLRVWNVWSRKCRFLTFAQYIDNVIEIEYWWFDWEAYNKLKQMTLVLTNDGARKYSVRLKSYELVKAALIKDIDRTDENRQIIWFSQDYTETLECLLMIMDYDTFIDLA